jgi:hypothetical protein
MSQAPLLHCGTCPQEKMAVGLAQTEFYLKLIEQRNLSLFKPGPSLGYLSRGCEKGSWPRTSIHLCP